jgi:hypothetical protein
MQRTLAKIIGREAQADGVPMERPSAECADAINADPVSTIFNRLPDVVAVKRSLFEKPEAALRQVVRPVMNVEVFKAAFASGLDQNRVRARRGQLFDHKAAGRAGADDAHVVDFLFSYLHALSMPEYRLTIAHCALPIAHWSAGRRIEERPLCETMWNGKLAIGLP